MTTITLLNAFQFIKDRNHAHALDARAFGKKLGLLSKIIGCPHKDIGRPFGEGRSAYRSCVSCGARKHFNTETLETGSHFYSAPVVQL